MYQRLRALHLGKKKGLWLLAAAELVLVLIGIAGLFGKNAVYEFGTDAMEVNFGRKTEEADGYKTDDSDGQTGNMVDFNHISLPAGVYRICLHYETDTDMKNMCTVTDDTVGYKSLFTNGGHMFAGLSETDFNIWLLEKTSELSVHAEFAGEGSLKVTGLTIRQTNALARMWLFCVVAASILINLIWCYVQYNRAYPVSTEKKNVISGLLAITVAASLPLMADYMISSGDLIYHLMRIEGIKDGLLSGQFPVRIAPEWQYGYGYASSVFYGETLLYPAALLRLIGFPVLTSYQILLFCLNGATALIAYCCFRRLFGSRYVGLLCSALYTLSVYRIYKTYCSGSLGETLAMVFLPFLVYGFYRVFASDITDASYDKGWVPLTIGFTGLIQSHLLTCELVGGFTILLCLILWKRVFRKKTFLVLAKTVIYSALLSAWFLVPFLDYMLTGDFVIQHVSARTIQYRGLYPAHLMMTFFIRGGNVFFDETGMYQSDPVSVGITLTAALVIWWALGFLGKRQALGKEELATGKICSGFALLAMLMSLSLFPWDKIQFLNRITATLVSSIQFPNRFLTIANILLVTVAGLAALCLKQERRLISVFYYGAMAILLVCSSIFLLNDILYSTEFLKIYNEEGMGVAYISGGEYLPYGTDAGQFTYKMPVGENVEVAAYEKSGLTEEVTCSNYSGETGLLELPLLYYKGYRTRDTESGQAFDTIAGNNNLVTVVIPEGYSGTVRTQFVSPWYWRGAELVSLLWFALLLGRSVKDGRASGYGKGRKNK